MGSVEVTIAAVAALLVGLLSWFGWHRWQRNRPVNLPVLFATVLLTGILCRLAFIFFTPVFYAPDEQAHFNYIKHLAETRAFPVHTGKLGDAANDWENCQPPLYYLLVLPVYLAAETVFHNPTATVFALRVCSLPLWLLNVWFGVVFLKRLDVRDDFVRMFAFSLVCLLPTYTCVSSAVNNDNLLATMSGAVLCLIVRRERSAKASLFLGLLLGLALLVKQSAVVFFPAILLLSVLNGLGHRNKWATTLSHLGLVTGAAALLYLPWAIRNWQLYGMLTPEHLPPVVKIWPSTVHGVASAAHNLVKTFWAVSGISNDIGYPLPVPGMVLLALSLAGLAMQLKRNPGIEGLCGGVPPSVLAALLLAICVNVILVLRFGQLYGMGQGRHLFPVLHPIALVLALGLRPLPLKNAFTHVTGFWLAYGAAFVVFSLCLFP